MTLKIHMITKKGLKFKNFGLFLVNSNFLLFIGPNYFFFAIFCDFSNFAVFLRWKLKNGFRWALVFILYEIGSLNL